MSRAGLRYSPLSEVTASQPANAHTSSAAAEPIASQPCGANGVRLPRSAWGSDTSVAASSSPPSTNAMTSCTRPLTRRPNQFMAATRAMIPPVASSWVWRPPPSAVRDVRPGEAGRGRRADRDREVEAPAHHGRGAGAEGPARVGRHARRRRGSGRPGPRTSWPAGWTGAAALPRPAARPGRPRRPRARAARSLRCRAPLRWSAPRPAGRRAGRRPLRRGAAGVVGGASELMAQVWRGQWPCRTANRCLFEQANRAGFGPE